MDCTDTILSVVGFLGLEKTSFHLSTLLLCWCFLLQYTRRHGWWHAIFWWVQCTRKDESHGTAAGKSTAAALWLECSYEKVEGHASVCWRSNPHTPETQQFSEPVGCQNCAKRIALSVHASDDGVSHTFPWWKGVRRSKKARGSTSIPLLHFFWQCSCCRSGCQFHNLQCKGTFYWSSAYSLVNLIAWENVCVERRVDVNGLSLSWRTIGPVLKMCNIKAHLSVTSKLWWGPFDIAKP